MNLHHDLSPATDATGAPAQRAFISTRQRRLALWVSVPIPIAIWACTGYFLASSVFSLGTEASLAVAASAGILIGLVEVQVLAAGRSKAMFVTRALLALLCALAGAGAVDTLFFGPEIAQQLRADAESGFWLRTKPSIEQMRQEVASKSSAWHAAQERATCEGDGRCGSGRGGPGPLYRELKQRAEVMRGDYLAAARELQAMQAKAKDDAQALRESKAVVEQSGLLARVQAMHRFLAVNPAALTAWLITLAIMVLFESGALIVKYTMAQSADERISHAREALAMQQLCRYRTAISTVPLSFQATTFPRGRLI